LTPLWVRAVEHDARHRIGLQPVEVCRRAAPSPQKAVGATMLVKGSNGCAGFSLNQRTEFADTFPRVGLNGLFFLAHHCLNSRLLMIRSTYTSRAGFTLIEFIAVLAIIGVLASLSIPRFVEVDAKASQQALRSSVAELNSRESLTWSLVKLSTSGWVDDAGLFAQVDTDLGPDFRWTPRAAIDGGNLHFKEQILKLEREPSLPARAGKWKEKN
jgi:prepilin-type N-terminal cleavage/methylation domain-containing protein